MAEDPEAATVFAGRMEELLGAEPLLPSWLAWIWRAWHALDGDRSLEVIGFSVAMGMTSIQSKPRRIPWSAVRLWSDRNNHSIEDAQMLEHCIAEMDTEYLQFWNEKYAEKMRAMR